MSVQEKPIWKYSVLMSVYFKENPEWLRRSIESIFQQTVGPDEFIIVKDGPLTIELVEVLNEYKNKFPKIIKFIELKNNSGLGVALQKGIEKCRNEIIMRMDSDDWSAPDRAERQLEFFQKTSGLGVVGCNVAEFINNVDDIRYHVVLPEKQREILRFAKSRCPFRHPAIMFRKSEVLKAGGYRNYFLLEDYDLFVRLLMNGCECYNIQEELVRMQVSDDFYRRRGGRRYFKTIAQFERSLYKEKFITYPRYVYNIIIRLITCMSGNSLRQIIYGKLLRKSEYKK